MNILKSKILSEVDKIRFVNEEIRVLKNTLEENDIDWVALAPMKEDELIIRALAMGEEVIFLKEGSKWKVFSFDGNLKKKPQNL